MVAVFGEFHGFAEQFTEAGVEREAEHPNLISGVVDVVFFFHIVTGERKQVGEGVADGAAPGVAHVEQTGGIGADEFNLNTGTFTDGDGTVAVAHTVNEARHGEKPVFLQKEVDKAGAGDLGAFNKGALGIEMRKEDLRDLPRGHMGLFGHDHGHIGGEVAVGRISGNLDHKLGNFLKRQLTPGFRKGERIFYSFGNILFYINNRSHVSSNEKFGL